MMKYFHFARMAFSDYTNHRIRMVTRFSVYMLLAWVMIAMWRVIYASGHGPAGISMLDMGWYNGIVQMMFFLSPRLFVVIDEDVRSGNIAYFLNRPIPYLWMRLSEGVGSLSVHIIIFFSLGIVYLYWMMGAWPSFGVASVAAALLLLIGGSIIHLLFQVFCGLSTFWTDDAVFIYNAYMKVMLLLGGIYLPISFYPSFMPINVIELLPFAAMAGLPSGLVIGLGNFWGILGLQAFWAVVVMCALHAFYAVCLKRVEVHGG